MNYQGEKNYRNIRDYLWVYSFIDLDKYITFENSENPGTREDLKKIRELSDKDLDFYIWRYSDSKISREFKNPENPEKSENPENPENPEKSGTYNKELLNKYREISGKLEVLYRSKKITREENTNIMTALNKYYLTNN